MHLETDERETEKTMTTETATAHKAKDNDLKHTDYINGFEFGWEYNRGLVPAEYWQETNRDKVSESYAQGFIAATGMDMRVF